jgi:hypothetical protein
MCDLVELTVMLGVLKHSREGLARVFTH